MGASQTAAKHPRHRHPPPGRILESDDRVGRARVGAGGARVRAPDDRADAARLEDPSPAAARALDDLPTSILERAYQGHTQDAARPNHENGARIGSVWHQTSAITRPSAPHLRAREVDLAAAGVDADCT